MKFSVVSLKDGNFLVGRGRKFFFKEPPKDVPAFYAPDFFLQDPTPWFTHETYEVVEPKDFPHSLAESISKGEITDLRPMFDDMTLIKGVIYASKSLKSFDAEKSLYHLIDNARSHFIYATEGIVGATPELLFDREESKVTTMSLAATSKNPSGLKHEKEQDEQNIVTQAIVEALSPFGRVILEPKQAIPYGTLFHTKTTLTLLANPISPSFMELIKALHPTPALGAHPRDKGWLWLQKWGAIMPRYRFGAPFGYQLPERGESRAFVAIRCVQWRENQAEIWAGAGVTQKSDFAKEREEVLQKMDSISKLMGI